MRRIHKLLTMMSGGGAAPILPLTIDFSTLADGPLPSTLTGATWTVSSGKAINTPTEGANLLTDGGLENWTTATNLTGWDETIAGTSTVNQDTDAGDIHGGSSAARLDIDASNSLAKISQSNSGFSIGDWVVGRVWSKASSAGKTALLGLVNAIPGGASLALTTGYAQYTAAGRVSSLTGGKFGVEFYRLVAGSSSLFADDLEIRKLTLSTLFAWLDAKESDVTVKASWTIVPGGASAAGVVMNIDNPANPANFIVTYHTGPAGTLSTYQCVNGTYTGIAINQAAPYVANAHVELRKTAATTYQAYYNGAQIGADMTINQPTINSNTYHGVFCLPGGNSMNRFFAE